MPRRGLAALFALFTALTLAGCALGKRPYFSDEPFEVGTTTGDVAVDAVLAKLDSGITGATTLAYNGLVAFGSTEFTAVALVDGSSRVVTISNAIYRETPEGSQTCFVDAARPCERGLDAAAASDTPLTIEFYNEQAAIRLRNNAARANGPGQAHSESIAGQPATCVDLPLPGENGTALTSYCVLDNGAIARINDGDLTLELVLFLSSVDSAEFALR